ncbi:MAG: DUF3794 domain-containing protein [Oscillospiraceae bacterium]|nr:DUF3794 domain-containing protein [Oscillospiraceae bacterium]
MPNQIISGNIGTTGKFTEQNFEISAEQDFLLADYDRPVFKIVKTTADHAITQKYINGNRLIIEGFFKISVWYQPPGAKLTVISKKIPFQKELELNRQVQQPCFIDVKGECMYVNSRAVNPTRIDVRSTYGFTVTGYQQQFQPAATAVDSAFACRDSREISYFYLSSVGQRTFSAEDEFTSQHRPDKILNITAVSKNMSVIPYKDKVNVKGEILADIVYTAENSDDVYSVKKTFLYNQVVDTPDSSENSAAYADLNIISFTVTQNPDSGKVNCIATAQLDVKIFRKTAAINVADAFSKNYESEKETGYITCEDNIISVNKTDVFTVEDSIPPDYTPVYSFARISPWQTIGEETEEKLKAKLNVNVIVKNGSGEYECFSKTEEIVLPAENINPGDIYFISSEAAECRASLSADMLKVKMTCETRGFIMCRKSIATLTRFEEKTDSRPLRRVDSLVLYYRQKGEKLFDIACRYKTDTAVIAGENRIEGDSVPENRMLFIPAYEI